MEIKFKMNIQARVPISLIVKELERFGDYTLEDVEKEVNPTLGDQNPLTFLLTLARNEKDEISKHQDSGVIQNELIEKN